MTPPGLIFAAAALVPAMTGSPGVASAEQTRSVTLALCSGGGMTVPLGHGQPAPGTAPCCAKGCHSSGQRRRIDRKQ